MGSILNSSNLKELTYPHRTTVLATACRVRKQLVVALLGSKPLADGLSPICNTLVKRETLPYSFHPVNIVRSLRSLCTQVRRYYEYMTWRWRLQRQIWS